MLHRTLLVYQIDSDKVLVLNVVFVSKEQVGQQVVHNASNVACRENHN